MHDQKIEIERLSQTWQLPPDSSKLRADVYLQRYIGRISRNRAQRIILAKDFLIDDKMAKPSQKIRPGQKATLWRYAPDNPQDIENIKVNAVFENEDFLVVVKPPCLDVHPNAHTLYKSLTFWLKENYPQERLTLCHRLDKETSGLIICAKNVSTDSFIKKMFFRKQIKKSYLAVVNGRLENSQIINMPLLLCDKSPLRVRMVHKEDGKKAVTKIRPIKFFAQKNRTLVLVRPLTGRQHQIRAHLSFIGHPIVGDKLYGQTDDFFMKILKNHPEALKKSEHFRHALHAFKLEFNFKGTNYCFKAPIPEDFFALL